LTGIYGEPLELLRTILQGSSAFAAFSADTAVHLYQRIGIATATEVGDAWAVVSWKEDGHSIGLLGGLQAVRVAEIAFVRAVDQFTEAAKEDIINDVSAVVSDIINADAAQDVVERVVLHGFAIDEDTEPPSIGATVRVYMGI